MAVPEKICSVCATDLNGQKRVKDKSGSYFCPTCWEARKNIFGDEEPFVAAPTPVPSTRRAEGAATKTTATARPKADSSLPPELPKSNEPFKPRLVNPIKPSAAEPAEISGGKLVGYVAVGIGAVLFFDFWPVYEANTHADSFSISIKGMMLGWMIMGIVVAAVLPAPFGIGWGKPGGANGEQPTDSEMTHRKIVIGVVVAFTFLMTFLTYHYIESQGYTIKF